jgi:hypothetical protein
MHNQPTSITTDLAEGVFGQGAPVDSPGQHPVAALSATLLRLARHGHQESQADFAARAGVSLDVVCAAEDGTRPVWALPYAEFLALADAVSVLNPWLREWFETAAACDLLLTRVLEGDQVLATDVLTDPSSRYLAKKLLRWAVTGTLPARAPARRPLLSEARVGLLRERAAALAASGSPDAWAGAAILSACRSGAASAPDGGQRS